MAANILDTDGVVCSMESEHYITVCEPGAIKIIHRTRNNTITSLARGAMSAIVNSVSSLICVLRKLNYIGILTRHSVTLPFQVLMACISISMTWAALSSAKKLHCQQIRLCTIGDGYQAIRSPLCPTMPSFIGTSPAIASRRRYSTGTWH